MIRTTNGRMRGQNEARSPIVYSCSPRAVGSRPCPMVLSNRRRNGSVRLIPPYSTALFRLIRFAPKLRRCAQKPHGSSSVPARIDQSKLLQMAQIIAQRSISRMEIDLNADSGKLAFPATIGGLKNLALRFIKVMYDAKRRNRSARQEPIADCSSDFLELRLQRRRLGTAQRHPI